MSDYKCKCGFKPDFGDYFCCGCGAILPRADMVEDLIKKENDRCSMSEAVKCNINCLETPLHSLSPTVIHRGGRGAIKTCLTNGADLYLGALVTDGETAYDIDLAQDDEIITGVIISPANEPLDIDRDYDNPFPDNKWVNMYSSPDEAELWCCINKKYKAKRMFEVIGKTYNEVAGLMWSGKLAEPEMDSLMHEGELSFT